MKSLLFKDDDGVKVYRGDSLFVVDKESLAFQELKANEAMAKRKLNKDYKGQVLHWMYFVKKDSADKYIKENRMLRYN